MAKTALIIQCDIVARKCVGYACMKSFETRTGKFAGLEEGVNYLSTTCGGCCGMGVAAKLDEVSVYLASCIVSDYYHNPPCPHKEYIKEIVERKGYKFISGTYISKTAQKKREAGIYKPLE